MRGQAGVEFMVSTILVLLFVLVFYVSAFGRTSTVPKDLEVEQLCNSIVAKISSVVQYGDGFSQNMTLPASIPTTNYTITVYNTSIICRGSSDFVKTHPAVALSNGTSAPPFTLPKRTISISNNRATIVIT